MDYGRSFTYMFEEDNWISKFLIGAVVTLIPIVNLAGSGYIVQLVQNVRDGHTPPAPQWDDFGRYFIDGLKFTLGVLVYAIPVILAALLIIPFGALAGEEPGVIAGLGLTFTTCLIIALAMLPLLLAPALLAQYARRNQIGDMFAIGDMWRMIQADLATYILLLLLVGIVLSFIAGLGAIVCGIGVIFTTWYAYLAGGHLIGQWAGRRQLDKSV